MTRLIFVRHGEALGNIERVFHGFTNSALTENGRRQAERLAQRLADEPIDVIYSSDLTRAFETAQAVAERKGMEVIIDERFREINGGKWEDVPWDDLPVLFPEAFGHWLDEPHRLQIPEGESMAAFQERLIAAVDSVVKQHSGKNICIATHGTAIRVLLCYFYGRTLEELNTVQWCDNASITVVEHDEKGFSVVRDGDNAHLADISTLDKQDWWRDKEETE